MSTPYTEIERKQIAHCLQYLAGVDDGAVSRDDHGFNKVDTDFGRSLALQSMSSELTPNQLDRATKLLQKYRKQLEFAGRILPKEKTRERTPPALRFDDGFIYIYFDGKPDSETLATVKALPDRRWQPDLAGVPWTVPVEHKASVEQAFPGVELKPLKKQAPEPVQEQKRASTTQGVPPVSVTDIPDTIINAKDGMLYIRFPNPVGRTERVAKVKELEERKWQPGEDGKPWTAPPRLVRELQEMFPDAVWGADAIELLEHHKKLAVMSRNATSDFDVPGLKGGSLMPFQRAGVEFLEHNNGRGLIADEMGLGKTIQALAYLQLHPEARPAVIVVPASLRLNWLREAKKWLSTNEDYAMPSGRTASALKLTGATTIIINYDILTNWIDTLLELNPQVLIVDEAHFVKNKKAQRSQALYKLAGVVQQTILLTGTPLVNRPLELYPLLNMLDEKAWGNYWRYVSTYCDAYRTSFGTNTNGASNLDQLHEKIKPYVVRRTKDMVLTELPPKRRALVPLELTQKARNEYQAALIETARKIESGAPAAHLAQIEALKQAAVKAKLESAIEWIDGFIANDEKIVVFCTHNLTVTALMEHFGAHAVQVTGSVSMKDRQTNVDRFQTDPEIKVFVGNIQAAGVGLTLTAASNVAFIEFPWTPGELTQAEDRTHRIGQHDSVTAWYLLADQTIDNDIVELLIEKAKIIDEVMDGNQEKSQLSILGELIKRLRKVDTYEQATMGF